MSSKKTIKALRQFQHAIVAVDTVLFAINDDKLMTVLLQIKRKPLTGTWALPGGLIMPDENFEQGIERHLRSKLGLKKPYAEQLYTFGETDRDPRGRVVSVAYIGLLSQVENKLSTNEDYSSNQWFDIKKLPALADDHKKIISVALERLRSKLAYTNIAQYLLEEKFTLSQLQKAYEVVLGHVLDKRNFRKKLLSLNILKEVKGTAMGAFRPAQLYSFSSKQSKIIEIL